MLTELPWAPEERWSALLEMGLVDEQPQHVAAKRMTPARFALSKSVLVVEEEEEEPQSPCEVTWSPMKRYNALVKTFKPMRGAKSTEQSVDCRAGCNCTGRTVQTSWASGQSRPN